MEDILINGELDDFEFAQLYREHSTGLYAYAFSILRSKWEAQDVVQETFVKIWEKHSEVNLNLNVDAYLFVIAKNLCISKLRRRLYASAISLEGSNHGHDEVNAEIVSRDTISFVKKVIDKLPQKRKEIFILSRVHGMSNAQIAEKLGVSKNTVETQIKRSLQFLRKNIDKDQVLILLMVMIDLFFFNRLSP